MTTSTIFPPAAVTEGAGVRIQRLIGTQQLRNFDPFLLLDYFDNDKPQDYLSGFPSHPHRGFITFTYMLDGQMEHQDSMGHNGIIGPGDAQWMKAAHGVIHSEMPAQIDGRLRGLQLWINLPAADKLSAPDYQELSADDFPVIEDTGSRVKLLVGNFAGQQAPITDTQTQVRYLDITLKPGAEIALPLQPGHNGFLFAAQGGLLIDGNTLPQRHIAVVSGSEVNIQAGDDGARLMAVSARPIGEPIVQHGPFVMNTREQINKAMQDYRDGTLTIMESA